MWNKRACLSSCIVPLLTLVCFSSRLDAQGVEAEPNQPCSIAQAFSGVSLPFTVEGELVPTPDVDFFLFDADPFEVIQADLEGSYTGKGTLPDPFLGLLDSDCNLLIYDDDGGTGVNSRLQFTVPEDGQFILGVTSCCDSEFVGGGEGSYQLTVSPFEVIGSISGRVVDEEGTPLPGNAWPHVWVTLLRCDEFGCSDVDWLNTDELGRFTFPGGAPVPGATILGAGHYALRVFAAGCQEVLTDPFYVAGGEDYDYGDLILPYIQVIGAVRGRLVDSVSREPISGVWPSWARVELRRCDEWGSCGGVLETSTDEEGRFQLSGGLAFITPGNFTLWANAESHYPGQTEQFALGEGESLDFGDFPLEPVPIQLELIQACSDLPSQGGTCSFVVGLQNRSGKRISGLIWSYIYSYLPGGNTVFQIGAHGSANPRPQRYNLKAEGSTAVQFKFDVPGSVPDELYICIATLTGTDPNPEFSILPEFQNFCIFKGFGGFTITSKKETRRLFRELRKEGRY